ncbi:AI-2E family transporter [Candidatus Odyssella thessalonicensis]|uniref:AI-2E family transporter n=1 Tax=Candidatus Odyssella thessalonicensis TaxID=84647 RepID=UPI000225ACB7|nr:AI-2E family transporter [Candidatus Odyssella thessalonicensis]
MNRNLWLWTLAAALVASFYFIKSLSAIFFPFLMGVIGAYAFNGTVTRLGKYRIKRGVASALTVLAVLMTFVVLIMVFIPFVQQQIVTLAIKAPQLAGSWWQDLKPLLSSVNERIGAAASPDELKAKVSEHVGDIFTWSLSLITNLLTNGMALANIISLVILTPIIMFYLLKDWPRMVKSVHDLIPFKYRPNVMLYASRIDQTLSDYARGQLLVCLALMVLYSVSLSLIGVNQPIFLGVMTGFLSFIPYIGAFLGLLATLANGLAHFEGWNQIILILVVFIAVGLVEGNLLSPRLIGERVGLHPVWIIFALLASATWFGFGGVLIALPVSAIIGVIVRTALEWYKTTKYYTN